MLAMNYENICKHLKRLFQEIVDTRENFWATRYLFIQRDSSIENFLKTEAVYHWKVNIEKHGQILTLQREFLFKYYF